VNIDPTFSLANVLTGIHWLAAGIYCLQLVREPTWGCVPRTSNLVSERPWCDLRRLVAHSLSPGAHLLHTATQCSLSHWPEELYLYHVRTNQSLS